MIWRPFRHFFAIAQMFFVVKWSEISDSGYSALRKSLF